MERSGRMAPMFESPFNQGESGAPFGVSVS